MSRLIVLALALAFAAAAFAAPAMAGTGAVQGPERPGAAAAGTRAAAWRQLREDKAKRVHPYVPKAVEKFAVRFEDDLLPRLTTPRSGFFPMIGRITTGGGFAVGPGYRRLGIAGGGDWTTYAAASIKRYWQIDSRLNWPNLAHGRAFATVYGRYYRFPREDFFGLGPDSDRADRSDFELQQGSAGAAGGVRPRPWLTLGGTTEYLRPRQDTGGDDSVPNADQVFSADELPGWEERHEFLRLEGFAQVQTAAPLRNPRKGGRYGLAVARYADTSGHDDGFTRVDVDLQHYLSVLNERRVFVVRVLGSFSDVGSEAEMPFYMMRTLGGSQTLRGFRDFRFRDRHLLALQAEYRFEIVTALDGAVFYDTGQVAPRLDRFRWREFERDWGVGFRFGGNGGVFLRLDLAYGGEGPRTWLRFGHVF